MKRAILVVFMVASAAALFANGNAEAPGTQDFTGPDATRSRLGYDEDFTPPADMDLTPVEITGTIEIVDEHAVLTADGKTYLLAIPRIAWYADEVENGSEITVTGSLVDDPARDVVEFDGDGHILVDQVEINGEVFDVAAGPGAGMNGEPAGRGARAERGIADDDFYGGRLADGTTGRPMSGHGSDRAGRGQMPRGRSM